MSARVIVFGSVLCAFAASGCAYGEVRQVVRAQFASELNCPEVTIKKRDAWYGYDSPNQWKVSGCGVMRTYTCEKTEGRVSYDKPACTWVAGDADAPVVHAPAPTTDDGAMDDSEQLDESEPPAEDEGGGEAAPPEHHESSNDEEGGGDALGDDDGLGDDEGSGDESGSAPAKPAPKKAGVSGGFKLGGSKKK